MRSGIFGRSLKIQQVEQGPWVSAQETKPLLTNIQALLDAVSGNIIEEIESIGMRQEWRSGCRRQKI
jgi:hypothetical protein